MAYIKTVWVDELLAGAERFNIKDNLGAAIYSNVQIQLAATVTTEGTPVDAANLNHIEDYIEILDTGAALSVKGRSANSTGGIADIVAATDGFVLRRSGTTLGFGLITPLSIAGLSGNPSPGADRVMFWDHSALAYAWLSLDPRLQIVGTVLGPSPEPTVVYCKVLADVEPWTTGDGKFYWTVPPELDGAVLSNTQMFAYAASGVGLPTVQLARGRRAAANAAPTFVDMLSTLLTIDVGEFSSVNATAARVINPANDDVLSGDVIRIDIDLAGNTTKGLDVMLEFTL